MAWNKLDIFPRIEARAAQLRKSLKEILPGGYGTFFAPSKAESSPTIGTLEEIAEKLEWSLCDLLCGETKPSHGIRADLIQLAAAASVYALGDRYELLPTAILSAYQMLLGYEEDHEPIDDKALAHIQRVLRVQNKGR